MKVEDIKTKFMKIVIFKNKLFVQDLNAKIMTFHNFNTNFSLFNFLYDAIYVEIITIRIE